MRIRRYQPGDCPWLAELFYNTVHSVNAKDYTEEQLAVWASEDIDLASWNLSFLSHCTYVAEDLNKIIGFGDIGQNGYLDRLYVHKEHQREGIGAALCDRLESVIQVGWVRTHASITAKPFFEGRGYQIDREQRVERSGVYLTNYVMVKEL